MQQRREATPAWQIARSTLRGRTQVRPVAFNRRSICSWETNGNAPAVRILFAAGDKLVNWTNEVNAKTIGVGDVFAVFVR